MAFPTVASRTPTGVTAASNSHTVNLDAANAAGDLLIMVSRHAAPTVTVVNVPTGWAKDVDTTQAGTSQDRIVIATKRLTAGDAEIGASTMTVTFTGGSAKSAYIVFRITGAHTTSNPEYSTVATGASTTPDPASLTASWGAEENLWIWAGTWEGEQTSPPAGNPTNYTNPTGASSAVAGAVDTNCRVATAQRNNAVATENPGSWTISASDDWAAYTIAVRPAEAGAGHTVTPADTLGLTDARSLVQGHGRPQADTLGLTDARSFVQGHGRALADGLALSDATAVTVAYSRTLADVLELTDSVTPVLGGGTAHTLTPADGLSLTDARTFVQGHSRSRADVLGLTDARSLAQGHARVQADTLGLTDALARVVAYQRTIADGLSLTDALSGLPTGAVERILREHDVLVADAVGRGSNTGAVASPSVTRADA